jgi:hypothetical protein
MRLFRATTPESDTTVQLAEAIRQVADSAESETDLQVKVSKLHGSQPMLDEDGRMKCERLRGGVMLKVQGAKSFASYPAVLYWDGPTLPKEDEEEGEEEEEEEEEEEQEEEEEGKEEGEEEANPR